MYQLYCGYGEMQVENAMEYLVKIFSVKEEETPSSYTLLERETGVNFTAYINKTFGCWGGRCADSESCLSLNITWNKEKFTDEQAHNAIQWLRQHLMKCFGQYYIPCYLLNAQHIISTS